MSVKTKEENIGKYFCIESKGPDFYGVDSYRFVSFVNGTRGVWTSDKRRAMDHGNAHVQALREFGIRSKTDE